MRRSGVLAAALLVAGLTAAVAAPSLHYGFVYDDEAVVLERKPFWDLGLVAFVQSRPWGTGRHVTTVSLDLDRLEAGNVPLPFHRTNIVLASLLSVLVLAFAMRLGLSPLAALASAALFAVHPTHVDAVASIVGRAELLAALGVVSAMLLSVRPAGEEPGSHRWRVAIGCALFAFVAVHSKESALCLPLLLVLARFFLGRRVAIVPALVGTAVAIASWAALIGPLLSTFDRPQYVDNPLIYAPILERVPKALAVLWRYALLVVWPHPLVPDRSWAVTNPGLVEGWLAVAAWFAAGLLALAAGLAGGLAGGRAGGRAEGRAGGLTKRKRAAVAAFASAWFPAAFAITGNVAIPIGILMAERLLLLPSVGLCLLAGAAVDGLATTPNRRRALGAATVLVVSAFFVLFREREAVWENPDVYFATSAAASPQSAKAQYDLGNWLLRKKDGPAAEAAFARALAIVPSLSRAASMRAESMARRGDTGGGADAYLEYLAVVPGDTNAMINVTRLLLAAGRTGEAVTCARKLVEMSPPGDQKALQTLIVADAAERRAAAAAPPVSP